MIGHGDGRPGVALVARAQTGDRGALDELLRLLQAPLCAHVEAIVDDPDQALDVMQRILWQVARRLHTVRDPRWVRAWAYRIATREAVRHAHGERRWRDALRHDVADQAIDAAHAAADDGESHVDPAELARHIAELPTASRVVVRLHYFADLTIAEIAEALEIPEGTVKSRLAYGLRLLRGRLAAR